MHACIPTQFFYGVGWIVFWRVIGFMGTFFGWHGDYLGYAAPWITDENEKSSACGVCTVNLISVDSRTRTYTYI